MTIGIDFPFGVPEVIADLVFHATTWKEFINSQNWGGLNPDRFRDQCNNVQGSELRDTDAMYQGDCAYSIRIYKQTFHGIREILRPLLQRGVSIAPMVNNGNTTILETYPAATLTKEDELFATRYKNVTSTRDRRNHNIRVLSGLNDLDISGISNKTVLDNRKGDAMDSLVAALATFRASHNSSPFSVNPRTPIEGYIYA